MHGACVCAPEPPHSRQLPAFEIVLSLKHPPSCPSQELGQLAARETAASVSEPQRFSRNLASRNSDSLLLLLCLIRTGFWLNGHLIVIELSSNNE